MSTDEPATGAGDAGDDPRGSTGEDGLADAPVVEPDVRWRERPADADEIDAHRTAVRAESGAADAVALAEVVAALEAVDWHAVPGVSAVTAATFAAEVYPGPRPRRGA